MHLKKYINNEWVSQLAALTWRTELLPRVPRLICMKDLCFSMRIYTVFVLVLVASFCAGYTLHVWGKRAYIFFLTLSVLSSFPTLFTWIIWLFTKRQRGVVLLLFFVFCYSQNPQNITCQEQIDCIPQGVHQGRFAMASAQWLLANM